MIEHAKSSGSYIKPALEQQRAKNAVPAERSMQQNPVQGIKETPAYIVELQQRYQSTLQSADGSLTEDTSEDALERFYQQFQKSLEAARAADGLMELGPEISRMPLVRGDVQLSMFAMKREFLEAGFGTDEERAQAIKNWEKYYNVAEKIAAGGKDTLLEYNLMFAGTTAYASDEMADMWANSFIKKGKYTQEEYDKIQKFANDLQNKSNVFVAAEFQYEDKDYVGGDDVRYAYMGAICTIGVGQLSFMAEHREADDIWTQLAQGAYQDGDALVQALRDAGYDDIAAAQEERGKGKFETENGYLWDETVGHQDSGGNFALANKEVFRDLKNKYFGSEDAKATYTAKQLNKAYEQGEKEQKVLSSCPRLTIQAEEDEDSPESRLKSQIESLKKRMQELQKDIQDVQETELGEEKKTTMVESFQKQIATIQVQINDALTRLAELSK